MEPKGSLPCSQQFTGASWPKLINYTPSHPISLKSFLLLSSHLFLGLTNVIFFPLFWSKFCMQHSSISCILHVPPTHPSHLITLRMWQQVKIIILLLPPYRQKHFPQHPIIIQHQSLLKFHTHINNSQIIVLHTFLLVYSWGHYINNSLPLNLHLILNSDWAVVMRTPKVTFFAKLQVWQNEHGNTRQVLKNSLHSVSQGLNNYFKQMFL